MSVTGSASSTNNLKVLKGKIASLSPFAVDPTLSVEGSAAEAKAVGDALEKKVSYSDIVDNLTTNDSKKPLSAKQGSVVKKSVDDLRNEMSLEINNMENELEAMKASVKGAQNSAASANETATEALDLADGKFSPDGSIPMTGNLDMDDNKIINVADPEEEDDAANKKYVDSKAGSKKFTFEATLNKASWATTSGGAPFSQSVVLNVFESDAPHVALVHDEDVATAKAQEEAWGCVSRGVATNGAIVFTCYEERPEVDLTLQIEVNR